MQILLKDLFRLDLVGESRTAVELTHDGKRLVYRTTESAAQNEIALEPKAIRALEQIVWDHSAAGSSVTSKRRPHISVSLDKGIHQFEALTLVARRFPELAARALTRAADNR